MCGIVGSVNHSFNFESINAVMGHRGPDERNGYGHEKVLLYHLRLSILAIKDGQQPMSYLDRYTIIFNGEIYNHLELRALFKLDCKTSSDTETLLHLYHMLGPDFLGHIDGMFALAIYDKKDQKIFLARDRAGKKPLYLYKKESKIVFASELNAINRIVDLEINTTNLSNYLHFGSMYRDQTPYKNITELLGGHYMTIDVDSTNVELVKWWSITPFYRSEINDSLSTSKEKVDRFLRQGIKRRVDSSDLEVGSFLSGGIDSGLVTAIASEYVSDLKTFTVSFGGEHDEATLAQLVADKYNTKHTEINISFNNLLNDVEMIVSNYGEPYLSDSAIPSYYVSKAAKEHITVVLNGDGADELFAGYRRYVPFKKFDFFNSPSLLRLFFSLTKSILPIAHNKKSLYNYLYRLISLGAQNGINSYLSSTMNIFEGFNDFLLEEKLDRRVVEDFKYINEIKYSGLRKIMNMDFQTILFSDLLVKMDIATMANSLEGRSPFLCKELLEYGPQIKDEYKINGKTTKYLLRELAKKYLPKELVGQPKRGFEIPLKKWVENDLKDLVFDYLKNPQIALTLVKPEFISQLLNDKIAISKEKRAKILWTLTCMEIWHKKVYKAS